MKDVMLWLGWVLVVLLMIVVADQERRLEAVRAVLTGPEFQAIDRAVERGREASRRLVRQAEELERRQHAK